MSDDSWEFVKSSYRNRAYVRRKPYTRRNPTLPQRKARYYLAKISHESQGSWGFEEGIPVVANRVKQQMSGRKFAPPKPPKAPEVLLNLVPTFEAIGRAVESFRAWNRDIVPKLLQLQREEKKRKANASRKDLSHTRIRKREVRAA